MSKRRKPKFTRLTPIERAILRNNWSRQGVEATIHALAGANVPELLGKAGSLFWVALHATKAPHAQSEAPERRVIRGAVNTLGDLAGRTTITDMQRGAITSGLDAVARLAPLVTPDDLFVSAAILQAMAAERPVALSDFPE